MAESFGADPERYDRTRPRYPDALVRRLAATAPGPEVLDVGTGTGIVARQLRAAGCRVLGVEVDARMAAFARRDGLAVEVSAFETWDAGGRTFDAVVAGQTWHWIDPVAGAARAAEVLRPGGMLAVFWNAHQPPYEVAAAQAEAFGRLLPGSLAARWATAQAEAAHGAGAQAEGNPEAYAPLADRAADGMRRAGAFGEPERWRYTWERRRTRDDWLAEMRTQGGAGQVPPEAMREVLAAVGAAIDALGGAFTLRYGTLAVVAPLTGRDPAAAAAA